MSGPGTPAPAPEPENLHASCVLVGACGVLLRGASGAGKSRLGDLLVALARANGRFATHVADDRVVVRALHGRLVATAPAALAGLWERRGEGIMSVVAEPCAVLRLVVDLGPASEIERLPQEDVASVGIAGVTLPRLILGVEDLPHAALRILTRLDCG